MDDLLKRLQQSVNLKLGQLASNKGLNRAAQQFTLPEYSPSQQKYRQDVQGFGRGLRKSFQPVENYAKSAAYTYGSELNRRISEIPVLSPRLRSRQALNAMQQAEKAYNLREEGGLLGSGPTLGGLQTAAKGGAATLKTMATAYGLPRLPASLALSAGFTKAGSALTGEEATPEDYGESFGRMLPYAGMARYFNPYEERLANYVYGKASYAGKPIADVAKEFIKRSLSKGSIYGSANVLEDEIFTRIFEGRAPTTGERAFSLGAGVAFGGLDEAGNVVKAKLGALNDRFVEVIRKVKPNIADEDIPKAKREWIRDEAGRFAKQGETKPQPKWMGDVREEMGLPRHGDYTAKIGLQVKPVTDQERGFIKTVKDSEATAEPVTKKVKGFYTPITNEETMEQAVKAIDTEGWDVVKQRVLDEPFSAQRNAEGLELMRRAQDTQRYDEAIEIAEALSKKGTEAGQAVQSFNIWGRMTPEGMLRYATKIVDDSNKNMGGATKFIKKTLGKDVDVKLSKKEAEQITSLMEKAGKTVDEKKKMEYTKQALNVINEKVPWGVSDVFDEYRYNNMLSNPLSHLRNAYSNALQATLVRPATLITQGKPVEAAKYYGGVLTSVPEAFDDAWKVMKGDVEITKPDLKEIKQGKLPTFWQLPSRSMEAGDKFFSRFIKNGMKSAGYSDKEAAEAAAYSLFRQDVGTKGEGIVNEKVFDGISNWLYKAPKPVRWFVPFIRTPMNIAKQWIDYSPAGVVNLPRNKNAREQAAKIMLGSTATLAGAYMASEDRTTWAAPTDPTAKQLFYASGRKPFSFKMGDKWIPAWYLGPFAFAAMLPAAVKHYQETDPKALTNSELDKIADVTGGMVKFVMSQTPLTGLNTFGKIFSGDVDYTIPKHAGFTASQTIPFTGMLNYIADVLDPIYRKPKGFIESIQAGIPGMTQSLQPHTDPFGQPAERLRVNSVLPYSIGIEDPTFEQPLKTREEKLRQNAVENNLKKQLKDSQGSEMSEDKYFYFDSESGNVRTIDFSKFDGVATTSRAKIKKDKELFKTAKEIYNNDSISDEDKQQLYSRLGMRPEVIEYYDIATDDTEVKTAHVLDEIAKTENREEMIGLLIGMRREVGGKQILSSGVIDDLYDAELISSAEKKALKAIDWDEKTGKPKLKFSGRGGGARLKKISFANVPKSLKIKQRKVNLALKSAKPGSFKVSNLKFRSTL